MARTLRFEELLFDVPDCNEFRKLSDGSWVAYSTQLNDDATEAVRFKAPTIREALEGLQLKLKE